VTLKDWVIAIRPFVLPIFFLLPLAGYAMQYSQIGYDIILLSLGTMFVGIFAHLYNNYDDFQRGIDSVDLGSKAKAYTAASQLLPQGKIKPSHMLYASIITLIIALMIGGYIVLKYWHTAPAAVAGFLAALSYNVFGFKYKALGGVSFMISLVSALLVGAMMHTFYVNFEVVIFSIFFGYIGFIGLSIDAYYDIETDRKKGIKTFPMLHKRAFEHLVKGLVIVSIITGGILVFIAPNIWIGGTIFILMLLIGCLFSKSLSNDKFIPYAVVLITILLLLIVILL